MTSPPRSQPLRIAKWLVLLAFLMACFAPRPSSAHEFYPTLLTITALGNGRYEVLVAKAPNTQKFQLVFPQSCFKDPNAPQSDLRFVLSCDPLQFEGQPVKVMGLSPLRDEVWVQFYSETLEKTSAMVTAARPFATVPDLSNASAKPHETSSLLSFIAMGALHFVTGADHVLFVIALFLLLENAELSPLSVVRRTAVTVTAFTLAHSTTLALSLFGFVSLSAPPIEAAIALSVLFSAREVLLMGRGQKRSSLQRCWFIAFCFGLLHGFGFASGLKSLLIPNAEMGIALFGFNVGLECSQLLVIGLLLLARHTWRTVARRGASVFRHWSSVMGRPFPGFRTIAAYGIGIVSAFWTLARASAFWNS